MVTKISETSFLNYLKVTCCSFKFQYLFPIIFSIIMEDLFDGACSFNRSVVCVYLLVCLWLIERGIYMVWPTVKELPITRKKTPLNRVESYLLYKRTELLIVSLPFLIFQNMGNSWLKSCWSMGELMNENQLIDQNEYHKILFPGI